MNAKPLLRAGYVLGFGLGGFFDGIVLHQLLQWHHLISNIAPTDTVAGLELNTLWDGIFHSAMYFITAIGLVLLWRAIMRRDAVHSPRTIMGAVLIGFGGFHLFDSIVNHWILGVHNIRPGPDALLYDLAFFAIGLVLIGIGVALVRRTQTLRQT